MTQEKRITVRSKPLILAGADNQGVSVEDVAICTKNGMDVRIRGNDMAVPDAECYFYTKIKFPWKRPDGSDDYEEIITDGDHFYVAFRPLGKQRMKWTTGVRDVVLEAVQKFVQEINQ